MSSIRVLTRCEREEKGDGVREGVGSVGPSVDGTRCEVEV
jgi:hypothetical protein